VRFVYKLCAKNVSTSRISPGCKYPHPGDGFVAMCSNPIQLYFSEYVLDSRDPADSSLSNGFDTVFSLAGKKTVKRKKHQTKPASLRWTKRGPWQAIKALHHFAEVSF
jgi:hypothetical protein